MNKIKILDCTLRDGGYVNNWCFANDIISGIINGLLDSKIEIIECGYLNCNNVYKGNSTIYSSLENIEKYVSKEKKSAKLACMINYGDVDIGDISNKSDSIIDILRVAFHKRDYKNAIDFCKQLRYKNYKVYIQPMDTMNYNDIELIDLINLSNDINAEAVYIVDTFGTMLKEDVINKFNIYDTYLSNDIVIGFHSHNNLQLSFSNTQALLDIDKERELVIDSSILGIGRGAGNLCTELIVQYINDNYWIKYNVLSILKLMDECIYPIYSNTSWGYSAPYYLAAVNKCHPNYATYLTGKQTIGITDINNLIELIPKNEKNIFNKNLIENMYIDYQSHYINDSLCIEQLKSIIADKEILVLAPGKSIINYQERIDKFIVDVNPIIISINFIPEKYKADIIFITNVKRFYEIPDEKLYSNNYHIVLTSNIRCNNKKFIRINYSSLVSYSTNDVDNSGIMLFRLLKKIDVDNFNIAGYDGFNYISKDNYYSSDMVSNITSEELINKNNSISKQLKELMYELSINFLTPSIYLSPCLLINQEK